MANGVGAIPLYSFARDFGFGCLTGISLPGEVRGMLREPGEWTPRSVPTIGIGQEVAVTALQLVGAYSAIANGGYLMEPQIIKTILADDGRVRGRRPVERRAPGRRARTWRPPSRRLLACATEDGTGKNARLAGDGRIRQDGNGTEGGLGLEALRPQQVGRRRSSAWLPPTIRSWSASS